MSHKRLAKQFHRLLKNVHSFSDGQAEVTDFPDSMDDITVKICPSDGLYRDAQFIFKIELDDRYPQVAPTVSCKTPIYHPNIEAYEDHFDDNVCVNILTEWGPDIDLESVVQALLYLFYQPDIDDPLSVMFSGTLTLDEYEANVKKSLRGGTVDGFLFERNCRREKGCSRTKRGDTAIEHAGFQVEANGGCDDANVNVPASRGRVTAGENFHLQNNRNSYTYAQQRRPSLRSYTDVQQRRTSLRSYYDVQQRRSSLRSYTDVQPQTKIALSDVQQGRTRPRSYTDVQQRRISQHSYYDVQQRRNSLRQSRGAIVITENGTTRRPNRLRRFLDLVFRRRSSKYS